MTHTLSREMVSAAASARLIVFVTFHFRANRVRYLYETLRSLGDLPVAAMTVTLMTNTHEPDEIELLRTIGRRTVFGGKRFDVVPVSGLEAPFDLTWSHKPLLAESFDRADPAYTHFLYMEEDIGFSLANFCYFLKYNPVLAEHGLIPAFIRVEYNLASNDLFLSDIVRPIRIDNRSAVVLGDVRFINSDAPYMAMFVMDRAHMAEYIATRSFDKVRSKEASSWWVAERAAMGLTWEAVPKGYTSRYVIPISLSERLPMPECYIRHLPANYTNPEGGKSHVPLGKLSLAKGFY